MSKPKHDWSSLKKEYILSDYSEVKSFMKDKGIPLGTYNSHTTGWTEERRKYWERSTEEIVNEFVKSKEGKEQIMRLLESKKLIFDSVIDRLKVNNQKLPMKEIKTAWEIIQTELGLTTSIKDTNLDHTTNGEKIGDIDLSKLSDEALEELKQAKNEDNT